MELAGCGAPLPMFPADQLAEAQRRVKEFVPKPNRSG